MIKIEGITKSYGNLQVLKGIDLEIKKAEIVSIVGTSGAGKTTLLQIIGTLSRPDTGNVVIDETMVNILNDKALSRFRNRKIGFVFQFHNLLPEFSALENVCLPALISGISFREAENNALKLLELLSISHRKNHKPAELSGGEQQRTAVARALINHPAVVLADEPSGNLDTHTKHELHQLFFSLRKELQQTFVIVTHDSSLAEMSDRIITLQDGKII